MSNNLLRYIRSVEPIPEDSPLEECYAYCGKINRAYGKSFYASSLIISREKRRSINALYGFLRLGDEIADFPLEGRGPEGSRRHLDLLREMIIEGDERGCHSNPIIQAYIDTAKKYRIPVRHAMRFLDSMEMDLACRRYSTIGELKEYTYGCASVVGILVTYVLGYREEKAFEYAVKLGHAMQMTNFLRDIKEDIRRGRVYLPSEDMERFGVTVEDIERERMTEPLRSLISHYVDLTRSDYSRVDSGYRFFKPDGVRFVYAARILYSMILDRLEAIDCDVFRKRAVVPMAVKLLLSLRVLFLSVDRLTSMRIKKPRRPRRKNNNEP
ncbi:MAG: phytoene/squalene synthase family protein [Candidatus Tritonobacter lacicola]|nr:phytoene/squalene synthase family protein [Candidatus Tritonobacter lacicola]